MAEQKTRIKIACESLAESDRAPLVSAINSAQRRISADLVWASAREADIHITDADRGDPAQPDGVVIRYSPRSLAKSADLSRPIRVPQLIEVLSGAIDDALARAQERQRAAGSVRRYRGAIVEEQHAPAAAAPPESAPERSGKVTYRGWRVD